MNVQSTGAVPVNQTVAEKADWDHDLLAGAGTCAGTMLGLLAAESAATRAGRRVSGVAENESSAPFLVKPEYAPALGAIAGYFVGKGIYHGLSVLQDGAKAVQSLGDRISTYLVETTGCAPWAQESGAIKACACAGAVWSVLAGRELMYSLVDINNPFPDSVLCEVVMGGGNEVINDSALVVVGAAAGYLAGKGFEYMGRKACAGIGMAARGVASLAAMARPDVMVEPDGGKKAA